MDRGSKSLSRAIILVGHGNVPADCPRRLVCEFQRLKAANRGRPTPELLAADKKIRSWPRTPKTDAYQSGLEALAGALRKRLPGRLVLPAYSEFCAPDIAEAIAAAAAKGCRRVVVLTVMLTRGGNHSEKEIPQAVRAARKRHPGVCIRYAWPYDPDAVAAFLAKQAACGAGAIPAP